MFSKKIKIYLPIIMIIYTLLQILWVRYDGQVKGDYLTLIGGLLALSLGFSIIVFLKKERKGKKYTKREDIVLILAVMLAIINTFLILLY